MGVLSIVGLGADLHGGFLTARERGGEETNLDAEKEELVGDGRLGDGGSRENGNSSAPMTVLLGDGGCRGVGHTSVPVTGLGGEKEVAVVSI